MFLNLQQTLAISIAAPIIPEQINEKLADKVGKEIFKGDNIQQILGSNSFLQTTSHDKQIECIIEPNKIQCSTSFAGKVTSETFTLLTTHITKILDVFMISPNSMPIAITLTCLPDYEHAMETLKALFDSSIFQFPNIKGGGIRLFTHSSTPDILANEIFIEPFLRDDNKAYVQGSFKYAQVPLEALHTTCSNDIESYYTMLSYLARIRSNGGM